MFDITPANTTWRNEAVTFDLSFAQNESSAFKVENFTNQLILNITNGTFINKYNTSWRDDAITTSFKIENFTNQLALNISNGTFINKDNNSWVETLMFTHINNNITSNNASVNTFTAFLSSFFCTL